MSQLPPWGRGVWVLLADQVLMNIGFFMLFPLLAVYLTGMLGFEATAVGVLLAVRQLLQQGTAPLGGALADRVGYKPSIVAGFGIRSLGFLLFAIPDTRAVLAATVVTSVGGSLFDAPGRAALGYLTRDRERQSVYAVLGSISWLGQAVGPLVGALLLPFSFALVSVVAAGAFLLGAIQAALLLPGGMRGEVRPGVTVLASIRATLRDADFARFTALLLGFYFLVPQMTISVPLLATRLVGPEAIGPLFAIQALLAMALQVPATRWAGRRVAPLTQVWVAMLVIAVGFAGYAFATTFAILAACTAVVAVGQLLVFPVQLTVTARLAGSTAGAYFGVSSLALAVGGATGAAVGGALVDLGRQIGAPWLPWSAMSGSALLTAAGFVWLARDGRFYTRLAGRPQGGARVAAPQPVR